MTIHSSLRGVNTLTGERSVLTRVERIQKLSKDGKFDPGTSKVWGLPKVRTHFKVAGAKKAKVAAAEGEAPAEGAAAAAAPAGAALAKGAKTEAKAAGKPAAPAAKAASRGKKE
jgi:small basic protein (TIGR04137 family)